MKVVFVRIAIFAQCTTVVTGGGRDDPNIGLMNLPSFVRAARFVAVLLLATQSIAAALDLTFPTRNRALLQGDGKGFYMFIDR